MLGDLAIEGFTCMIIFKNLFSFGLTLKAFDWLTQNRSRAEPIFNALGAVQIVASVLTIPLCKLIQHGGNQIAAIGNADYGTDIYGKRLRSWSYRHDILAMFGVR